MGAIVQTQQQSKQKTGYLLFVGLFMVFPVSGILALLILALKKAVDFHATSFKVITALLAIRAFVLFLDQPQLLYYISIVPIGQTVTREGLPAAFKVLGQFLNNNHIFYGYWWASIPLLWLFTWAFTLMNDNLKAPVKTPQINTERVKGDKEEGVMLGELSRQGSKKYCCLSPEELNKHVALIGTTGSGKTTTIYNFVEYAIVAKQALIVINGKGERLLNERIEQMARKSGRKFYLFSTAGEARALAYNPFTTGDPTELTDKLMSLTDWSEEHYKLSAQRFLQLLFRAFQLKAITPDLSIITKYTDKARLLELLRGNNTPTTIKPDEVDCHA